MKAILISIKPKWVSKILNGEKTIEVRKSKPKCDLPIDVYIYCTKGEPCFAGIPRSGNYTVLNGKVVAKFTLNRVEEIIFGTTLYNDLGFFTGDLYSFDLYKQSCLTKKEMQHYLKVKPNGLSGYAWHISNLVIFDRPRELGEFNNICPRKDERCHLCKYWVYNKIGTHGRCKNELTKAPQSYQFIEVGE